MLARKSCVTFIRFTKIRRMKMLDKKIGLYGLVSLCLLSACHNSTQENGTDELYKRDTSKLNTSDVGHQSDSIIKIAGYYVKPKKSLELYQSNCNSDMIGDTFTIAIGLDYVYSPFGTLTDKSQISNSLLKNFFCTNRMDTMDVGVFEFQILHHDSSRLILFFDHDSFASRESYVFDGDIKDTDVNLAEEIRIGMSKKDFIKTFFDEFPDELLKKYDIIAFESGGYDIRHTYTFKDEKLETIYFRSHTYWPVKY